MRVCPRGADKDPEGVGDLGKPVVVGDVDMCLGDLVVADADGVVCVLTAPANVVRRLSHERDEAEAGYIARIRVGETTLVVYPLQ